ncbi:ubiquitin-conjugating enzyme [Ophiocordyceps camponoti-floridani]|uniref:Ubiquitin-conjugating enzyme n=1 Tax=Ophiocordyceps camponoti-floridani TaxID=2030778 RepID=A0A8H4QDX2_9HYPO|nr:ubiquitin-conjugating enzyme [Ophiocordyceps camponoti-floridani]
MPPLPYVPARDCRHRIAALALYRALVRSARAIPLPPDLAASRSVAGLVRRRFVKHRHFTSPRLLYIAMTAGYRFLTMFVKAHTASSAENGQLVDFLRSCPPLRPRSTMSEPEPEPASRVPAAEPLIRNIAAAQEPPRYAPSRTSLSPCSLEGSPRKVPIVATTAHGQPFLRIHKPQPALLSQMIGRKETNFKKKILKVVHINDDLMPAAEFEDDWDRQMAQLMEHELGRDRVDPLDNDLYSSFRWSVILGKLWVELQIERTWQDWNARGLALHEIAERERALAEQESAEPDVRPRTERSIDDDDDAYDNGDSSSSPSRNRHTLLLKPTPQPAKPIPNRPTQHGQPSSPLKRRASPAPSATRAKPKICCRPESSPRSLMA